MGVLLFLLTTGKYPFEDPLHPNSLAKTISNVLAVRVQPFPTEMSNGCRHLISGLLQRDPAKRRTLAVRAFFAAQKERCVACLFLTV